jgi:uncharacterized protein YjdB
MLAQNLRLFGAIAVLITLAFVAASCDGFFVDPTLTSVSVGPQNLQLNVTEQWTMSATGTYSDGTQKTLNSGVVWNSSDPNTVAVEKTSGKVTGQQVGTATITASSGSCSACSGSTTVTVVLTGVNSVIINPSSQAVQVGGSPVFFTATASGTDITNSGATTWTVVDATNQDQTSNFTISFQSGSGEGFLPNSSVTPGTYTVKATYSGVTGTATLTVQ